MEEVLTLTIEYVIGKEKDDLMLMIHNITKQKNTPFNEQHVTWPGLKQCLEKIGRDDIVEMLQDKTLLTKGKSYTLVHI